MLKIFFISSFSLVLLLGCAGYHFKKDGELININLISNTKSAFVNELKDNLDENQQIKFSVFIIDEKRVEQVLTYNSQGQGKELKLSLRVLIKIEDLNKKQVFNNELQQKQIMTLSNNSQVDNVQKKQVFEQLRKSIVQQLILKLSNL